jgi:hypothetical protein
MKFKIIHIGVFVPISQMGEWKCLSLHFLSPTLAPGFSLETTPRLKAVPLLINCNVTKLNVCQSVQLLDLRMDLSPFVSGKNIHLMSK